MAASISADLPPPIVEILRLIDPLRRPQPFEVESALRAEIDAAPANEQSELAIAIAEWIFLRCTTCDVAYTYNVLALAEDALQTIEGKDLAPLAVRAHLVAARAYAFHQPGTKADNLSRAAQHIDDAAQLGAAALDERRWAAALLDVARAGELAGAQPTAIDLAQLRAHLMTHDRGSLSASTIEELEQLLERYGDDILPFALAPMATRLGSLFLSRAASGDGNRARYWFQAAERSSYYNPSLPLADYARNQLGLAGYFAVVSVNDPEDEEYVLNKGLFSLNTAYQLAGQDVDLQAECGIVAARLGRERAPDRASQYLTAAAQLDGLSPAVKGRVLLEHARLLALQPAAALPAVELAIEALEAAPEAEHDLLQATLLKARLLLADDSDMAIALMSEVAARRVERGEVYDAYSIHRQLAQLRKRGRQFAQALPHYEECRRLAQLIIDRDLRAFADEVGGRAVDDARRDELMARPTPALVRAHRATEVGVQLASVDHQAAAYCAAKLGRLDEALRWMLGSRLRNFLFLVSLAEIEAALAARPAADQIVAVPIVAEEETLVLLYRQGHPVEALPVPLTYLQLSDMVRAEGGFGYQGWIDLYREYEQSTPADAESPAANDDASSPRWWRSLENQLKSFGEKFAEPLLAALTAREIAADRLLLVPTGMLSFMPLHAVVLSDGSLLMDRYALQLGFTPALPRVRFVPAAPGPAAALVMRGDNELIYTELETRTIRALLAARSIAAIAEAASREQVLEAADRAKYLHIASHGVFDAARWIDSRIELGAGEVITLREICQRNLAHVRLATLSACESGVSHLTGMREEFLGFPVVFAAVGVGAVLATLWRVDDLASALLLEAFYRRYLDGAHAAIALNDARKQLRSVTAGELVERARAELAAPKSERLWRPVECSGIIGRFEAKPPQTRPFESARHWAAFVLWQTD